jgi:hypothetical protein
MDKDNDIVERLKKRIDFYLKGNIPIHIVTETDEWINGYIINFYDDYVSVLDRYKGEMNIFYVDIRKLDYFKGDYETLKKVGDKDVL